MMKQIAVAVAVLVVFAAGMVAIAARGGINDPAPAPVTVTVTTTSTYKGVTAYKWSEKLGAMRGLAYRRLVHGKRLRRALLADPQVLEAIELAGATYGQTSTLRRVAWCESRLQVYARNNSSADSPRDVFQFKPSTWASTPYRGFSIWSPYAAALAAGWMRTHGRAGEWECK